MLFRSKREQLWAKIFARTSEDDDSGASAALSEDMNAVVSSVPFVQRFVGRALSIADGTPSLFYRCLQVVCVVTGVLEAFVGPRANVRGKLDYVMSIMRVALAFGGLCIVCLIPALESVRVALRPETAAIWLLSAGKP